MVEKVLSLLGDEPLSQTLSTAFEGLPTLSDPIVQVMGMSEQLKWATMKVIAKAGVANASLSRIGRVAQVSTGTIYPRFSNFNDILLDTFDTAISQVTEENLKLVQGAGFTPEQFGAVVMSGLSDSRQTWRDFRVETHLEARFDNKLAAKMRLALEQTNARVAESLGLLPISQSEREAVAFLVHTIGIGMAVLKNVGVPVDSLDHRIITNDMIRAMATASQGK